MNTSKSIVIKSLFFSLLLMVPVEATNNANRYFTLLERPEKYTINNRSHFEHSCLYINISTAMRRNGSTGGIPELWGQYDLNDVIKSLREVRPDQDPIFEITGNHDLDDRSMQFRVHGKVRGHGLTLGYEHDFCWGGLQCGASISALSILTTTRFNFDREKSDDIFNSMFLNDSDKYKQRLLVDKIRRRTHDVIGFNRNYVERTGLSDLDLHLRWNHIFDHVLLMKTIDLNLQAGVIVPTGMLSNVNVPVSLSFGSNGHWGLYGDFVGAFELKQDLTIGLMLGFVHLFPHTRTLRIPVDKEPALFSSLVGNVKIDPATTFKVSPYVILGNLTDGLDFQVRYTYLRHGVDHWNDARADKTIPSYLQGTSDIIRQKEELSKWRGHYVSMQVSYDTKTAMKDFSYDPVFFALYDIPVNGRGIANTHRFTVGAEWHF